MSIANLSDLKAAIGNWTARTNNAQFNLRVPEFITLAETRIFYGGQEPSRTEPVRVRDMEVSANVVITTGAGTIPDVAAGLFLEFKRLYWSYSPDYRLDYVSPREFHAMDDRGLSLPNRVTIEGGQVLVRPAGTGTLKTVYWRRYAPLLLATDTNWLLTNAPAVYLQAALVEAWGYIRNPDAMQMALAAYKSAAEGVTEQAKSSRLSGETLRVRSNMWN